MFELKLPTFTSKQASSGPVPTGGPRRIEPVYSVARTPSQRRAATRLVYESYLRAGLCRPNPWRQRITPYHLLDTTTVFVASVDGLVVSTVTLIEDGEAGLPMEAVYPEAVRYRREQGYRVAEVSCLADRRRHMTRFLDSFISLTRLVAQFARHHGVHQLMVVCHPRHARFYRRFMCFETIGGLTECPHVCDRPAVALCLDFAKVDRERPAGWERFFGESIPAHELERTELTDSERREMEAMIDPNFTGLTAKGDRVATT